MKSEWYEHGSLLMHMVSKKKCDRYILNATRFCQILKSVNTNDITTALHICNLLGINTDTH